MFIGILWEFISNNEKLKKKVIGSHKWSFWIKSIKSVPNRNRDHTIDAFFCFNDYRYLISELENRKRVPILWYLITHFLMHVAFSLWSFLWVLKCMSEFVVWTCAFWFEHATVGYLGPHWYDTFWFKLSSDAVAACKRNFAVLFLRWILSITALLMA